MHIADSNIATPILLQPLSTPRMVMEDGNIEPRASGLQITGDADISPKRCLGGQRA